MDPLVIRFGSASGELADSVGELERAVDAHGGRTFASWTISGDAYAIVDISPFIEDIDHVFSSIPVEFRAGAPVATHDLWVEIENIDPDDLAVNYHIDLPEFDSPAMMTVNPQRIICGSCYRIGHSSDNCPYK